MNAPMVIAAILGPVLLALTSCAQTPRSTPIDAPSLQEGLERVNKPGVDAVYRKPGASLSGYDKLLIRPVEVAFAKNWTPGKGSGSALYAMNPPDRERIKQEIARVFQEVFTTELQTRGGYRLVDTPAADVLELRAAIVNIYINAPDVSMQTAGRVKTYTADAGEMTLVAELHDSVTGELLSRVYDRRDDMGGSWQWTTSVTNTAEGTRAIKIWADTLRAALDASREQAPQQVTER